MDDELEKQLERIETTVAESLPLLKSFAMRKLRPQAASQKSTKG